jgi:hypothetical protein
MSMPELKDVRLTFTVAASDEQMLKELAAAEDVSMSQFVRKLVRQAHAEKFPPKRPKK